MEWWLWAIAGLALLALEMLISGLLIFVFFGAAAIVMGVLAALGLAGPVWLQWVLFSLLSVVSLMTLRGPIVRRFDRQDDKDPGIDSLLGQPVVLLTDLAPGAPGKAELRGASWSVVGVGELALPRGARCVVEAVDGLTLHVRGADEAPPGNPLRRRSR
ncbi:MAG: NfeD family protein [Acidobacteriota bacterium]|nr:NfeD family protein [Acidobacteriota bacterium]